MECRIEQAVEVLRQTPATLRSLLDGLSDAKAKQYGDAVGPWKAYLGILNP